MAALMPEHGLVSGLVLPETSRLPNGLGIFAPGIISRSETSDSDVDCGVTPPPVPTGSVPK